ncbi:MAG: S41 family peptidase [Luteibaculaceae bacterium]
MSKFLQLSVASFLLVFSLSVNAQQNSLAKQLEKLNNALFQIDRNYVDTVDLGPLIDKALIHLLEELDPHSTFISAEDRQKMNEPLQGNFEGIGVSFNIIRDTLVVVEPVPEGPSEKVGVRPGDKIIEVDGEVIAGVGITNKGVADRLRGKKGTKVKIGVQRKNEPELLYFLITRDKIPINSVLASYMIDKKNGYIKVSRFAATTPDEFSEALNKLKLEGMQNLILDLQGNGGGYLKSAISMVDEFIESKKLVVYTEGRSAPRSELLTSKKGAFETGKLIVLIDEGSASASEIVSGAIQDWDRGIVIGRRSFGKGLVQRPIPLPDGSEMRLTISRYYTPSGRSIQRPYDEGVKAYRNDRMDRYLKGELTSKDSIHLDEKLMFKTSKNRNVYGGGGIMPDIFVPLDTNKISTFVSAVFRKGLIMDFAYGLVEDNRDELKKKFPTVEDINKNYQLTQEQFNTFVKLAEEAGVEFEEEDFKLSEEIFHVRVKAHVARNLYGSEAFYKIINNLNDSLNEAIKLMNSNRDYKNFLIAQE